MSDLQFKACGLQKHIYTAINHRTHSFHSQGECWGYGGKGMTDLPVAGKQSTVAATVLKQLPALLMAQDSLLLRLYEQQSTLP